MFTLISALRARHLLGAQLPMDGGDIFIQLANHYWTKSTSTTFLPSFFPDISRNLGFPSPFIYLSSLLSLSQSNPVQARNPRRRRALFLEISKNKRCQALRIQSLIGCLVFVAKEEETNRAHFFGLRFNHDDVYVQFI